MVIHPSATTSTNATAPPITSANFRFCSSHSTSLRIAPFLPLTHSDLSTHHEHAPCPPPAPAPRWAIATFTAPAAAILLPRHHFYHGPPTLRLPEYVHRSSRMRAG